MKKKVIYFFIAITSVATVAILSCQKDEVVSGLDDGLALKSTTIVGNCSTNCIDINSGDEFFKTASNSVSWGGPQNNKFSKTLTTKVWNTLTTIEYRFVSTEDGNLEYYDEGTGDWIRAGALIANTEFSVSRPLPEGWSACTVITEQWREAGSGPQLNSELTDYELIGICTTTTIETEYEEPVCVGQVEVTITGTVESTGDFTGGAIKIQELINDVWVDVEGAVADVTAENKVVVWSYTPDAAGDRVFRAIYDGTGSNGYNDSQSDPETVTAEVCGGCEESFSYINNGDGTITFTYMPVESGSKLVEFTFAQAIVVSAPEGFTQPGNGRVRQKTEDFTACTAVSWTFDLSANCTGGGQTFANVFTDFKIDGTSKKFGVSNITFTCP